MMKVEKKVLTTRKATNPEDARQAAGHCLYVEGNEGSIDQVALRTLLRDASIRIEVLGPCYSVSNVAEALYNGHQHYYFLIDRDGQEDHVVEGPWSNFPNPTTKNLLVWRRKEIENYFIDPDFISKFITIYDGNSDFEIGSLDEYINKLQQEANKRIYFDAANRVILKVRHKLNHNRFDFFKGTQGFETEENALQRLLEKVDLEQKVQKDSEIIDSLDLKQCFVDETRHLLGGSYSCTIGSGKWLEHMGGKKILHSLIASPLFRVRDRRGNELDGTRKLHEIVKAMTSLDDHHLPGDFQQLKHLIVSRL